MQNIGGKGLPITKRLFKSRAIGSALGFLCIAVATFPLRPPDWVWALMILNGFIWPAAAFQWSRHSTFALKTEQRNLLLDSFFCGFWVGTMQFNLLPSVTSLSMMGMNNIALGGVRLLLAGWLAQALGLAVSMLMLPFAFQPETSTVQMYACVPLLAIYPLMLGRIAYQQNHLLKSHKRALLALSQTDSLSGLLNHGAWKAHLDLEFQRCTRAQQGGTIALIDIDHFKVINDTYGHVVGDIVLRQLSRVLNENLRCADLAGRYGGDEFCVILPDTSLATATEIMDRLRDTFSATHYEFEPMMKVSLSIGLAPFSLSHVDATYWLSEADKALYGAKGNGRNRVSCRVDGAFHPILIDPA
ncbi:diguanylate cyclase [Pseudomonas sp. 10B1]|uniref:diguanylate cyclase n=1 Tax=unclassified Pseudomonas TaxID=196821 RepID=UPI002AB3C59C|nr:MULTISPECIES: diguanylate cyclase [unclassified Pseudomonas]MDY7559537.1 diguanylate cyclase [Pseudomonas sp. AB6]MEA9996391.1 diguanylate cyclase [Pseudomonas sp. AA4]MEB0088106.1 diguanylate cyclase [Pseudomonas sp. RTI1]MEB0126933.1 diguanylate cyclase [Pseudomonas sp. CCC1.2]MEB0153873.1 diguanylate cyclase [Pseudomonas sp. CCC4.3]